MCGAAVSWSSKLQATPVLYSTGAENMAVTRVSGEAIWLRQLLEQFGDPQKQLPFYGDNQGAIVLVNDPGDNPRSEKYSIVLSFHFLCS